MDDKILTAWKLEAKKANKKRNVACHELRSDPRGPTYFIRADGGDMWVHSSEPNVKTKAYL